MGESRTPFTRPFWRFWWFTDVFLVLAIVPIGCSRSPKNVTIPRRCYMVATLLLRFEGSVERSGIMCVFVSFQIFLVLLFPHIYPFLELLRA